MNNAVAHRQQAAGTGSLMVAGVLAVLFLLAGAGWADAATTEEETLKRLALIREIKPQGGRDATDRYNRQMDEAWRFFRRHKDAVLPVLRREVAAELRRAQPNQMLLLDIGYFLRLQQGAADRELGKAAFFAVDPAAEIVRWNGQQLFSFAHAVVPDRDPRTLAYLDQAFLRGNVTAFIPQHALSLDETLVCVFLYGIYGPDAEQHLKAQLADPRVVRRVLEILVWIGSPQSVAEVAAAMDASRDYDTFVRATAFMMSAGGPRGRAAMLAVPIERFDARSREYYAKVRPDIEATGYEALRARFEGFGGAERTSDAELRKRLADMYRHYGRDDATSPLALLRSGLPKAELVAELSRIRARTFFRISDEALDDVKITDALLNTLYYKPD